MKWRIGIIEIAWLVFAVSTTAILVGGILSGAMEYFYLSMCVGLPFLFGLMLAARTRSDVIMVVALAAFVSGWLTPLGFFWERDKYAYSGMAAVKDFNFSVFTFIGYYIPIIAGYFVMLGVAIFLLPHVPARQINIVVVAKPQIRRVPISPGRSRWIFVVMLGSFAAINWWMFNNSIGITGINPPELPFKLSGILYYSARFIFPGVLIYLLTLFRPTAFDLLLLIFYACFAALTSVSKTTLILMFSPVLISSFLTRRYVILTMALILLAVFYPVVNVARNFVFLAEEGISVRNVDFSIVQVLLGALIDYTSEDLLAAPLSVVERIGGGQDVALAAQYDNARLAGPLVEFVRLYIFDFFGLSSAAQEQMYDYQPDVLGYATGDGGFFAHMLLAGGRSVIMLLWVSIYSGLVLAIGDATHRRLVALGISREVVLFYAVVFCLLFFVLSIPLWLNVFLVVSFVGSRTRLFAAFVRSRQRQNAAVRRQSQQPLPL